MANVPLQPMDERVLVKPIEQEEKKFGSIIIPDTVKEKPTMAVVVALGFDVEKENEKKAKLSDIVKIGDKVLHSKYGGTEIEWEGEKYLILSRTDILALVK
ncbi:MAG: co-chaperone GroES [bacterium]|nr:co-chaperone GroES [bacterium]